MMLLCVEDDVAERIHLVLDGTEKERFRQIAARAGQSLSEWLREAAQEKALAAEASPALDSAEDLRSFFAVCDAREVGQEPDWEAQRALIERSIGRGAADA
jgi:hypothetical protein